MNFKFIENSVIVIPFIYSGYRLEGSEKVRFRCLFKNAEGDFPYTLDVEEDNRGTNEADGKFTITLDMGKYDILPGRYAFDLSLVLESGSLVTLKSKSECHIDVVTEAEGLYKPNGEIYFGADYIVEAGKIGEWTYEKRASGIAKCWCRTHSSEKVEWDSMSVVCNRDLPFEFVDYPVVNCSGGQFTTASSYVTMVTAGPTYASAYIKCAHEINDEYVCWFCFDVKGRWK